MKQWILLLLASAVTLHAQLGDPGPDRYARENASQKLKLVENGKALAEIIPAPGANAQYAAGELQRFIERATGAKLPIVQKKGNAAVTVMVGTPPPGCDVKKLPRDGFVIKAVGNNIYIAGRDQAGFAPDTRRQPWGFYYDRATLFGVYGFLERYLGARLVFPFPETEFVRKSKDLIIPAMDIFDRPDNIVRQASCYEGWGANTDLSKVNDARLRMQTEYIPNCHGLGRLGYIERFGKTHPEYFALRANGTRSNSLAERMGGQLCFSSNIKEEIYQDAKAYFTGVSAKDRGVYIARFNAFVWDFNAAKGPYFNVMPQDGMTPCQCEKCAAEIKKNPHWPSEIVWKLTVDIAKRLEKEGVKGQVTQMAYGETVKIPPFDIPGNIPIQVAIFGPWGEKVPHIWKTQQQTIRDWTGKIGHKVWLWTYVTKYSGRNIPDIPCSTPVSVARFYKLAQPHIFGGFMESSSDKAVFQALNWYIYSRIMWNKNLDGEKEFGAMCDDFFGKGAPAMKKFFAALENIWLEKICGKVVMTPTGPEQIAPSQYELWNQIYSPAVIESLNADIAAAKKAAAGNQDAVKSIEFWEREYLHALRLGADKFHSSQKALTLLDKVIPEGTVALDGTLSDPAWKNAATLRLRGLKDAPVEVDTTVRLLRDKRFLYIGYRCEEPRMADSFVQNLPRDDGNVWSNESAEIFLDPGATGKKYIQFMVNPAGSFTDLLVTCKGKRTHDLKFDSKAVLKTHKGKDFWSFVLAIPLTSLDNAEVFKADFARSRVLRNAAKETRFHTWSPFVRQYGDIENFGTIRFAPQPDNNLLKTSTFEPKLIGRSVGKWITDAYHIKNGNIAVERTTFLFDGQSLRMDNDGKKSVIIGQYIEGLKPDTKYRLRLFVKVSARGKAGRYGGVFLQFNDGANRAFPGSGGIKDTMPWTCLTFDFTTRKDMGKHQPYLRLYNLNFNGTAWFDGVTLEELP